MNKSIHGAEEIAAIFVAKAAEANSILTHKKLQKLLYYSQAWNLVFNNEVLFQEEIQAWVHGPVVASLYDKYKGLGMKPFVLSTDIQIPKLTQNEQSVIDSVWQAYGSFDADYLEMLTHSERPWIDARAGLDSVEPGQQEILPEVMKAFYGEKLQRAK